MKKLIFAVIISATIFSSCCDKKETNRSKETVNEKDSTVYSVSEHQSMATLWFQKSAEARALFLQTYNFAEKLLTEKLKKDRFKLKKKKPKAIIADIDETVLNNSPYNARLIKTGTHYTPETWTKWVNEKKAKALPGARNFFNNAKEKGVEIFYVSNRSVKNINSTVENLKNEGLPFADKKHVLLKDKTSDKTARRDSILKNYDVIMYLGDNLRDFNENFKYTKNGNRNDSVKTQKEKFGDLYIIFPNPMYGEWEKAVYEGNFGISDLEKQNMRLKALKEN